MSTPSHPDDVHELRQRLEEAEETLRAIRCGEVDALVVEGAEGERVYTLQGADHPYRALIECMQQGAVSLSADGTVLYCNRCFAEMVKRPHEKVLGAGVSDFLPASQQATFDALLRQARTRSSQGELQFLTAEGTFLPVYVALAPLPLADAVALCMVVTDLTEQKKQLDLREANRRKDEFLATLAHELRNPLAPIRNSLQILKMPRVDAATAERSREMIERQVFHLVRLVDDLLDVSRVMRGRIELRKERVELATVISRAVETAQPVIEAQGHELTISVPEESLPIDADPVRVAQVVGNLLTNAAKYTERGGHIALTARREADRVVVRVRDTGIGISPDMLPRIFDLFVQVDHSATRSQGGLGIGLTLVRNLVEMHRGTVEARSPGLGKGSEFVVRLPLSANEPEKPADGPRIRADRGHAAICRRLLVVDDNVDAADSLAVLLRLQGHDVRVAHSGPTALELVKVFQPELIFLDIGMPGMDGYEVARRLRQEAGLGTVRLAALTGWGQLEDRRRSSEAGFDHHLVKPVEPSVVVDLLADLEPAAH